MQLRDRCAYTSALIALGLSIAAACSVARYHHRATEVAIHSGAMVIPTALTAEDGKGHVETHLGEEIWVFPEMCRGRWHEVLQTSEQGWGQGPYTPAQIAALHNYWVIRCLHPRTAAGSPRACL